MAVTEGWRNIFVTCKLIGNGLMIRLPVLHLCFKITGMILSTEIHHCPHLLQLTHISAGASHGEGIFILLWPCVKTTQRNCSSLADTLTLHLWEVLDCWAVVIKQWEYATVSPCVMCFCLCTVNVLYACMCLFMYCAVCVRVHLCAYLCSMGVVHVFVYVVYCIGCFSENWSSELSKALPLYAGPGALGGLKVNQKHLPLFANLFIKSDYLSPTINNSHQAIVLYL